MKHYWNGTAPMKWVAGIVTLLALANGPVAMAQHGGHGGGHAGGGIVGHSGGMSVGHSGGHYVGGTSVGVHHHSGYSGLHYGSGFGGYGYGSSLGYGSSFGYGGLGYGGLGYSSFGLSTGYRGSSYYHPGYYNSYGYNNYTPYRAYNAVPTYAYSTALYSYPTPSYSIYAVPTYRAVQSQPMAVVTPIPQPVTSTSDLRPGMILPDGARVISVEPLK